MSVTDRDLKTAIEDGRAVRILTIDQVDEVVRELVSYRSNEKAIREVDDLKRQLDLERDRSAELKVELDRVIYDDDQASLIHWALRAGADPFDSDLKCAPATRTRIQQIQAERGYACGSYEPKGRLEICKCGKGRAEHARELV